MDVETIRSRNNPLFRRLRELRDHAAASGHALLEGPKLVEEALLSGIEVREAAASPRAEGSPRGARVLRELAARGVPVRSMSEELLSSLSSAESSQGLLAIASRPAFEEAALFAGLPLVVVAVGVQDPGNLGGLLRTAEAAGATGAYLTAGCADPFGWKALRGSMGSALRLPHVPGLEVWEVVSRLRSRGVRVAATAADAVQSWDEADLRRPTALLFGNEGAGLGEDLLRAADLTLRIPLAGRAESLNVGVAAGIVLFEAARQRRR